MMDNIQVVEQYFKEYTTNLETWIPDGVVKIDLSTLHDLDLVHTLSESSSGLTCYFQVIETYEKITLLNDQFVVWIVPDSKYQKNSTYILIALNTEKGPKLDMVFEASGIYNTSKIVLSVLEKFMKQIQENEEYLHQIA